MASGRHRFILGLAAIAAASLLALAAGHELGRLALVVAGGHIIWRFTRRPRSSVRRRESQIPRWIEALAAAWFAAKYERPKRERIRTRPEPVYSARSRGPSDDIPF